MSIWKEELDEKSLELKRAKQRIYRRRHYAKNREEINKKKTERDRYKDRSEWSKKYYAEHREEKLRKKKEWYEKNREAILKRERARYHRRKRMEQKYKEKEQA